MAGMNLNPYGLNNNQNNNKMFSNHYSGNNSIDSETIKKEPNPYLKAYGFKTTNPKDMDLNKKVEKPKSMSKIIIPIIIFIVALIIVLMAIFL